MSEVATLRRHISLGVREPNKVASQKSRKNREFSIRTSNERDIAITLAKPLVSVSVRRR